MPTQTHGCPVEVLAVSYVTALRLSVLMSGPNNWYLEKQIYL